jgi:membrane fusion protein (multidrug efflux system)
MSTTRKLTFGLIATVSLGLMLAYFAGAFHSKVSQTAASPTKRQSGEIIVARSRPELVTESVPGTVQATDATLIGSRIIGSVVRVNVRAGARVTQGDLLVELDDQALKAALEQRRQEVAGAKATLEEARLARDRSNSLIGSGSISQAALDKANADFRVAQANAERAERAVAEAEAAFGYSKIRAPMTGTIVERFIEPGDTATPGRTLLRLYNPGRLRVEATLRESLVRQVGTGDSVVARIDALDVAVPAIVEEIVPAADPGSRTFTLKALLPQVDGLFPGMFARVRIPLGTEETIHIPAAAVQRAGQLEFVYVRTSDGDERRFVRTAGPQSDETVIVRSGIANGESVVVPQM